MGAITLKKYNGVSLIELMVVVAIVGIIAAIALPSYRSYVLKSHRTAAINAIMDLGSREARYYTTNNTYTNSMTTLGYASDPMPVTGGGSTTYYNLSAAAGATGSIATSFTLQAVPTGNQTNDTCGTYTYTDLGQKNMIAAGGVTGTVSDCWKQ